MEDKKFRDDIQIFLGTFNEYNVYRLDTIKAKYSPFIKNFSSLNDFMRWQSKVTASPLLRDSYLAILNINATYKYFESLLETLMDYKNEHVKLVVIIQQRERFFNMPEINIKIIDLNEYIKDDFKRLVELELPDIDDKSFAELIRRIGYSIHSFNLYKDELKEKSPLTPYAIKKIIIETRIAPIEFILFDILTNKSKRMMREHYKLCNRYSEYWVISTYKRMIKDILEIKGKLRDGEMTYSDIHKSKDYKRYLRLVRDTRITDVFLLKYFLERYNIGGLEMYLISGSTREQLELVTEIVEYEPFSWDINEDGGIIDG